MTNHLLDVQDLHISFDTHAGEVQAVRGVSFWLDAGEMLSIVGESGCGKSVTIQTIMKLLPSPPSRIKSGSITYQAPTSPISATKPWSPIGARSFP